MKDIQISFPSLPSMEEFIEEIRPLWETGQITNTGPKVRELENMVASFLNSPNATVFANGHISLEVALQALGLHGEVITTPYTFVSTVLAVLRNGLKPVFCDVKEDYTIDESLVEEKITERTCAILPVHVYGNLCNVEKLAEISEHYGIPLIYDAAHAFGVRKNGLGAGQYGDFSMFSFHATKVFNSVEGGALTYIDQSMKTRLEKIRNFGLNHGKPEELGLNAKMSEIHASMGLCNLRHLDEEIRKRKLLAELYDKRLYDAEGIKCNEIPDSIESNYAYYPIRIIEKERGESRDTVLDRLKKNGIYARKYYSPLMTDLSYLEEDTTDKGSFPVARQLEQEVITLPLNTRMTDEDVERICEILV